MEKEVAIVVLNYNDCDNTINYINQIKGYEILSKIIVVDNNSTNENEYEKLSVLKSDKVTVLKTEKNGGYSYGNNYGIRYIENNYKNIEYVIISNPDISVEQDAIKKCVDFFSSCKDAAIVAPRMYYVNGGARRSAWKKRTPLRDVANSTRIMQLLLFPVFKSAEYSKKDFLNDVLEVDNIAGSFFVADMKKFKKIGYFDENVFLFYEEDIIGNKIKEKGYKIYSLNDIKFIHYDSRTIGKLMSAFKKQDILFDSRIYYQKEYNKVGPIYTFVYSVLRYIRKFELLFEVGIKKIIK